MGTVCQALVGFDSLEWNAHVYEALSGVSYLAISVRNKANVLNLAFKVRRVNLSLNEFFEKVELAAAGKLPRDPNSKPATREQIQETAFNLSQLHRSIIESYAALARVGLLNNSLTSGALRKLNENGERILDIADWFDLLNQQDQFNKTFDRAAQEKAEGRTVDLDQVM